MLLYLPEKMTILDARSVSTEPFSDEYITFYRFLIRADAYITYLPATYTKEEADLALWTVAANLEDKKIVRLHSEELLKLTKERYEEYAQVNS